MSESLGGTSMTDLVDITTTRALAKTLTSHFGDLTPLALSTPRQVVEATLSQYRQALVPIRLLERDALEDALGKLKPPLRNIGLRMRPDFTQDQARMWVTSQVDALTHLPPRPAIAGALEAKHAPLKHPSEVQEAILELAKPHQLKLEVTERQLIRMLKIQANPPAVSNRDADNSGQLSHQELQNMNEPLRLIGLGAGWLTQDTDGVLHWAHDDEDEEGRDP